MKKNKERLKINFRQAEIRDLAELVELEKKVWKENAAGEDKILSRLLSFPEGNIVALYQEKIVGYVSFEYVDNLAKKDKFTWSDVTDNGYIKNSHRATGKYVYGLNLSVHHSMNGQNLGTALVLQVWADMIKKNKRGTFVGSRLPGFRNYKKHHPETTAEAYVALKRNGKPRDYELKLYQQEGLRIIKVLPNYFPDPPSLDYGVLVYRSNPFYNWPFKRLWAWAIKKIAPAFIRSKISAKKEA